LLIEERRDAEAAAEGMTKELEAEYKSQREALDDVLLNTVDAVPRIIEEAYVFLKLLREERTFIEGRRDAEAAAVAPIDAAGPGSGVPDPSGRGSFMDEWKVKKRITADLAKPIAQLLGPKGGLPKTKDKLILLAVALDIPSTGTVAQLQARCRETLGTIREGRRDAEAASAGMAKDQEAEYQSYREALDDFLLDNVDAVPRTMIEEADVLLKLLEQSGRLFIAGMRDGEAAAVAPQ